MKLKKEIGNYKSKYHTHTYLKTKTPEHTHDMKTHSGKVTRLKKRKDNSLDIQVKRVTQKEQQFSLSSAYETLYKKRK